ncbi:MAG: M48 family metalloprotease [Bacteroidales bacterium]|nr:M48 family metalloprotease [Bacteroidales bacterium]
MKALNIYGKITSMVIMVALVSSCAVNPVTGKKQLMFTSEAREVQMGAQYDPQVVATFGEYQDAQALTFIQAGADEMGLISHRPKLKYHVRILDSPVVNAFAVPGGYIYLTRGILTQFNNEAELMGVLGHEMGHITARHSMASQSKQTLGQLLLMGGMIASEEFASYAQYAMQGMQLLFLKFSRDDERQADQLGVAYSTQIGYDAGEMAEFFRVLEKMSMPDEQGGVPTFLSTHPSPADRYNAVKQDAQRWKDSLDLPQYKVNGNSYLQMIDGMVYGEDPRQGYVDGNTFYHPELRFMFTFPAGWKLENMPAQINIAPPDGKALMVFTLSEGASLEAAASSTLEQLELKPEESSATTINGMPAIVTVSRQVSQNQSTGQQQTRMVLSHFINYDNKYYAFHGVSSEPDFPVYSGSFTNIVSHFSRLTDPARLNKQPTRLQVRNVQRSGTLEAALKYYGVPQDKLAEVALLNDMELSDMVQSGKAIKVIGQ